MTTTSSIDELDDRQVAVTDIDEAKVEAFAGKVVHKLGIGHKVADTPVSLVIAAQA